MLKYFKSMHQTKLLAVDTVNRSKPSARQECCDGFSGFIHIHYSWRHRFIASLVYNNNPDNYITLLNVRKRKESSFKYR